MVVGGETIEIGGMTGLVMEAEVEVEEVEIEESGGMKDRPVGLACIMIRGQEGGNRWISRHHICFTSHSSEEFALYGVSTSQHWVGGIYIAASAFCHGSGLN
jgi:hypothetical protein